MIKINVIFMGSKHMIVEKLADFNSYTTGRCVYIKKEKNDHCKSYTLETLSKPYSRVSKARPEQPALWT